MPRSTDCLVLLFIAAITFWTRPAFADDIPFDCHVLVDEHKFDLTPLAGQQIINRTRQTPPSEMIDSLRFNLCGDLEALESLPEHDQCPKGTRTCLTTINRKEGKEDRVVSVVPIVQTSTLKASYSVSQSPKALSIVFSGSSYPHPNNSTMAQQSMDITLTCDPSATNSPKFTSYDGVQLIVNWTTPAGCFSSSTGDDKHTEKPVEKPVEGGGDNAGGIGRGIGRFFLLLILALLFYFALGTYYNYSMYGATGYDLIPHRDFWQEVPYMLRDVVSHLCSDVGARRSSRSGYIAV
ncbi:hypothetical protein APHAL10511_004914 [Amanita phalloides]|nr:hypothetical protein APHAL10511_004914 [Amanita phalloides]